GLREWHQLVAGAALDIPDADLRADLVELHQGWRQGVLRVPAAAGVRPGGRLYGAGFVPVLCVLGSLPGADVLPDRNLGTRPAHLRRGEVLPVHDGRVRVDADGDHLHLQSRADVQLYGDPGAAFVGPPELCSGRADAAVPGVLR